MKRKSERREDVFFDVNGGLYKPSPDDFVGFIHFGRLYKQYFIDRKNVVHNHDETFAKATKEWIKKEESRNEDKKKKEEQKHDKREKSKDETKEIKTYVRQQCESDWTFLKTENAKAFARGAYGQVYIAC